MQLYQKTMENCVKTHVFLKKASLYACLTLFAGMAFTMHLWASLSTAIVQQHVKQITGIVKDANGDPVIGANVVQVGSTNGTITDVDGNYSIDCSAQDVLVFSYVGYATQEIAVKNQKQLNVVLKEDTKVLDEVIVIGYGTTTRKSAVGAVDQVKASMIEDRPVANMTDALQGAAPNVVIQQRSSNPNDRKTNFNIRGISTVNDNSPLFVIDGL